MKTLKDFCKFHNISGLQSQVFNTMLKILDSWEGQWVIALENNIAEVALTDIPPYSISWELTPEEFELITPKHLKLKAIQYFITWKLAEISELNTLQLMTFEQKEDFSNLTSEELENQFLLVPFKSWLGKTKGRPATTSLLAKQHGCSPSTIWRQQKRK